MGGFLHSVLSFLAVLGPLVIVHEFGHYWVARRAGVKILRFSVGFGPALWRKQLGPDATEFVVAGIPLGGYVKMLDEREGEVAPEELHREFNRKPLGARAAIVLAGPLANLVLAVVAFWLMFVIGVPGLRANVGEVIPDSPAARAGMRVGDHISAVQGTPVATIEAFKHASLPALLNSKELTVEVTGTGGVSRELQLAEIDVPVDELAQGNLLDKIGFKPARPQFPAIVDEVLPEHAAARSGMRAGDEVISANGVPVSSWEQWVTLVQSMPDKLIHAVVRRGSETITLELTPAREREGEKDIGRIGAKPRLPDFNDPAFVGVERFEPLAAVPRALAETWDTTVVTLKFLIKMVSGQASAKNLGGPISIAQSAGETAKMGLAIFMSFVAVISVSLGVLNLLPIPILDGGHLMYYLMELVSGRPVSIEAQQIGQQIGILILGFVMSLAFYNDIVRVLS